MDLFVLMSDQGSDRYDVIGIFSTKEKAEEYKQRFMAYERPYLNVVEYELDKP